MLWSMMMIMIYFIIIHIMGMSFGSHCWGWYSCTLSCDQASATHLRIGHPYMKSTGARSSNGLQWLNLMMGHQDNSLNNGHQADMLHWGENHIVWQGRRAAYSTYIASTPFMHGWKKNLANTHDIEWYQSKQSTISLEHLLWISQWRWHPVVKKIFQY